MASVRRGHLLDVFELGAELVFQDPVIILLARCDFTKKEADTTREAGGGFAVTRSR